MGLIDKDALIEKLESNAWNIDEWELPHDQVSAGLEANAMDRETVENMPTVDAIPVEWILKNERMPKDGKGRKAIMDMLEDWRKEHDKVN